MTEPLSQWFHVLIRRESPDVQVDLLQRLVASMVLRRRQIEYRQSRQKRWDLRHEAYTRQRTPVQPPTVVPEVTPQHVEAELLIQQTTGPDHNEDQSIGVVAAPQSAITLTTLDRKLYHKLAAPSRISRGTSATLNPKTRALVPPPPRSAAASREFVCEYCCLVLDGQLARDRGRWM
jgi:hypothetical protein